MTVHEAWVGGGFGAEVVATVAERAARDLQAPVRRVGARPIPIPGGRLRQLALPDHTAIVEAVRAVMAGDDR